MLFVDRGLTPDKKVLIQVTALKCGLFPWRGKGGLHFHSAPRIVVDYIEPVKWRY
jgi:hypothetical protein